MPNTFEAVRAEALFASCLQCSEGPTAEKVREVVTAILHTLGENGCAASVASEYGDHPETAVARMAWALEMVRKAYSGSPEGRALALTA